MTTSDYNFTEITENSQLEEPNMEKAEVFFNLRAGHDLPKKKPQVPQPNGQPMYASTPMGLYARRNMINIDGSYRAKKWVKKLVKLTWFWQFCLCILQFDEFFKWNYKL